MMIHRQEQGEVLRGLMHIYIYGCAGWVLDDTRRHCNLSELYNAQSKAIPNRLNFLKNNNDVNLI